jgi:hypothetical protein
LSQAGFSSTWGIAFCIAATVVQIAIGWWAHKTVQLIPFNYALITLPLTYTFIITIPAQADSSFKPKMR